MRTVEALIYNPNGTRTLYRGLVKGGNSTNDTDDDNDQQVGAKVTEGDQQRALAILDAGGHPELKEELLIMARQQKWSSRQLEDVARKTLEIIKKQGAK